MDRLPDGALMGRAAAGLASVCATLLGQVYGARIAILAGSGDNGGDALFAGAILARRGAAVTAIAASDRIHEAGAAELRGAGGRLLTATSPADDTGDGGGARGGMSAAVADALDRADLIIDGLLGIGGRGGLREPAATLARLTELARVEGSMVVAVDLPSGVDADTGVVAGPAIRADVTVTFGTWKPGLLIDPGASYAGTAELIDIGLAPQLGPPAVSALQAPDIAAILPQPTAESNKYRRGVLGVLAGSQQYSGAAVLATGSAIHGGAGMVRLVSSEGVLAAARQHWPEAVMSVADPAAPAESIKAAGRVQAWTAGPGMGTGEDSAGLLAAVLATSLPVLVDADGITILAAHRELLDRSAPTLITPALGRTGPADRRGHRQHRGAAAGARDQGGRRPGRHGAAQGLDHGHRRAGRAAGPGQLHRLVVAGHGRLGRRPVRAGGRAARAGHRSAAGRRRCGLPARPGRAAGRAGRAHRRVRPHHRAARGDQDDHPDDPVTPAAGGTRRLSSR